MEIFVANAGSESPTLFSCERILHSQHRQETETENSHITEPSRVLKQKLNIRI